MTDVHQPPPRGKGALPSTARRQSLQEFIDAGKALNAAWTPEIDTSQYPRYLPPFDRFLFDVIDWRDHVTYLVENTNRSPEPLPLDDPAAVRAWLERLKDNIEDVAAAGDDATRPPSMRELGRATARNQILESRQCLRELVDAFEHALLPEPGAKP